MRATGDAPTIVRAAPDKILAAVTSAVAAELAEERSVGVVAPEPLLDAIAGALRAAGVRFADGRRVGALSDAVTLVPPESAKGLEFDAVVVVEPAAIAAIGGHGLRLLYIALTRAVRTLTLVHATALPASLSRACGPEGPPG